ncbi:hypothetical protein PPERSA_08161 [Pseudocohnilembus persalinus]|uniref:Uncharacterized protein n=1 Tax=Pseudocohnilembus persalinus TaxID=266149 RepID=A0A0V0R3A5_PSEPJ|nr:hypothetical protein PPERSA_08161 [Pseudocohnilembus persalinus]|eukprot:KRX08958.1 hypothetical protein PPERSA_08161 [Pseudocohnilembus persalinus]
MSSQYEIHTDISKRFSKVQIANRLTVFYVQHDNKIEPFFDNLIDIYKSLFSKGESLKERLDKLKQSSYQTKQENSINLSEKEIPENEQKNILLNQKYINQNYDYIQRNGMSKQQQHILKLKEQEQQNFRADRFASNQTIQQNTIIKKQIGLKEYQQNIQQNNIDPEKDPILKIIKENQDITTKNDENIKKYTVNKKYFRESPINQSIDQDYNNYANDSVNEGFQGNKGNYDQMNFMSQNSMPQPIKREMLKVGQKMNQKNIDQLQKFYKNQIIQQNNYFADLIEEVEYVEKMRKQFDKRARSAEPPQNMITKQKNTVNYNQKKQTNENIQSPKNHSLQNNNKTYDEDLKMRKISQNKGSQYIQSNNTLEPFVTQNQPSYQSPKKSQILSTTQNQNLVISLKNLSSQQQQLQNQQPLQLGISLKNIYNNKLNINSKSKSSQKFQQKNLKNNQKAQTQQSFNRLKIVKTFKKQQDSKQNEIMKKDNLNFLIHQDQKLQQLKKIHKEQLQKEIKEENQQQEFMEHAQQLLQLMVNNL